MLPLAIDHHNRHYRHYRHISMASVIVVMVVTITRIVMAGGKEATKTDGRRKGYRLNRYPLAVCIQAIRYTLLPVASFADTMFRPRASS
jgi:hypothetical protein